MSTDEKKRKRAKNTTSEQYEMYVATMEGDYTFRSNTVNPTLPQNDLEIKWSDLAEKLNSVGKGPALSGDEWKKRFSDWKYSVKAKWRKIKAHGLKTGGGPSTQESLSCIEERALAIWGTVTVTGSEGVTPYEGLPSTSTEENYWTEVPVCNTVKQPADDVVILEETFYPVPEPLATPTIQAVTPRPSTRKRKRERPLSALAENLINIVNNNVNAVDSFTNEFSKFTENYLKLKREKLDFEIKKFKYLHPDFEM